MTLCTWNPARVGSNITLSNGDLTFASTNGTSTSGQATLGYPGGMGATNSTLKLYFEATTIQSGSPHGAAVGLANENQLVSAEAGVDANSIGLYGTSGVLFYNFINFGPNFFGANWANVFSTPGVTVGVATRFATRELFFTVDGTTWNDGFDAGGGVANPLVPNSGANLGFGSADGFQVFHDTGAGVYRTVYPAFSAFVSGDSMTANFGATPFVHTVPSGFSPWDSPPSPSQFMFSA